MLFRSGEGPETGARVHSEREESRVLLILSATSRWAEGSMAEGRWEVRLTRLVQVQGRPRVREKRERGKARVGLGLLESSGRRARPPLNLFQFAPQA